MDLFGPKGGLRRKFANRAGAAAALGVATLLVPSAASAHPAALHAAAAGREWSWEPGVIGGLAFGAWSYARGVRAFNAAAGEPARRAQRRRTTAFAFGLLALFVALVSPLDAVAEQLFSAHMVQHLILILVAAPLVVLGAPNYVLLWALPRGTRVALGRWWTRQRALRAGAHVVVGPGVAWVLHAAAVWAWHMPVLYQAALLNPAVHAAEHLSFFGTAFLFWWCVLQPMGRRRLAYAPGVIYVMTMALQGSALGALITFSTTVWYPAQGLGARAWHLTVLEDQQLAGLVMWIPAGFVYLGVALWLAARWMQGGTASARTRRTVGAAAAAGAATLAACNSGGTVSRFGGARTAGAHQDERAQLAALVATPGTRPPNVDRGRQVIVAAGCGACHMVPSVSGADGMTGPPLLGWSRRTVIAEEIANTPENLVHWLVNPQAVEPGTAIPNLGLTDAQARDVAAYLYTLW